MPYTPSSGDTHTHTHIHPARHTSLRDLRKNLLTSFLGADDGCRNPRERKREGVVHNGERSFFTLNLSFGLCLYIKDIINCLRHINFSYLLQDIRYIRERYAGAKKGETFETNKSDSKAKIPDDI